MQVKSAQTFRSSWCKEQGYTMEHWDENFIGSNAQNGKSGFYKMVNGIVENIKADLTPKLQNAQDEQAMYEFLQNAADSQATACAIVYDEEYFMVLNNGKPFTEKDLKALLNSFQGTKADKTKPENCGKIGRYGIGFKLAYRLLGKSDGAEELVRDLAGPLLFSWHNPAQLHSLLAYQTGAPLAPFTDLQSPDAPWLLKIILACFPTLAGEEVKNLDYQTQVLFPPEELASLVGFLQKHKEIINGLSLSQGSLFFLKFGAKKYEKLKESLVNIKSGIGYAMNTLKTLQRVVLQDEVIERYPVAMENFAVLPESEEFKRIDPEFPFCPIDISLGFLQDTAHAVALKAAPSIYQFFPMRNERHNLAFFVHSTSFAKITDRTRLDDQGESNIETFKHIAQALKKKLNKYKNEDFDRFALIYKALLLSDKSKEYDAPLINAHLYEPLLQYIQANIPTRKGNVFAKDLVIIKGTRLPIEPMQIGIGKEWLYWTKPEDETLQKEAANNAKLGLRLWTLRELLLEGSADLINTWIEDLEEEDYAVFMQELGQIKLDLAFSNKLKQLKAFKFKDNKGRSNFYAIDDLKQAENVFLVNDKTAAIAQAVKGLGFSVLEFGGGEYGDILKQLAGQLDYLTNEKTLFLKITQAIAPDKPLKPADKQALLAFFQDLKAIREEEIRQIPLFCNRLGKPTRLSALLPTDADVPAWLDDCKILPEEENETVHKWLVGKDSWEVYGNILRPMWAHIIENVPRDLEQVSFLYQFTTERFAMKAGQPKLGEFLRVYIDETTGFVPPQKVLYKKSLESVSEKAYPVLKNAVLKAFDLHLPARETLPTWAQEPFKLGDFTAEKEWKSCLQAYVQRASEIALAAEERQALFAILYNALPLKEAVEIPVFVGENGRVLPLKHLIHPEAPITEAWLAGYKLKPFESDLFPEQGVFISLSKEDASNEKTIFSKEKRLLVFEDLVYNHLILEDWGNITQHPSIAKGVGKFYEAVGKYAQEGKSTKTPQNQPYIYAEKQGFLPAGAVFYHPAMRPIANEEGAIELNYKALQSAITALTGLPTPHEEALPYLQDGIFKTKELSLAQNLPKEAIFTLNREEILALQRFLDKTNEHFFELFTVTEGENPKDFVLERKTAKSIPCFLEKYQSKIAEKLREMPDSPYKILPLKAYLPLQNKGLLQGAVLFDTLSKSKELSEEMLTTMLAESGNAEIQQKVFSKIDKIVLKHGTNYSKDMFEHQALQIFRNKDADFKAFRAKIFIEDSEGNQTRLDKIAFAPTLSFAVEKAGKFTLQLAEVLPTFKGNQAFLEEIFAQIQDYEAPASLKKRCFELEELDGKAVLESLRKQYAQLRNGEQLAFVWIWAKMNNQEGVLAEFEAENLAGEYVKLSENPVWHLQASDFIDAKAVFSARYAGVGEHLHLHERRAAFEVGKQRLILEPYFEKDTFFATPLSNSVASEEELGLSVLEFAYQKWANLEENTRPTACNLAYDALLQVRFKDLVYPHAHASDEEYKLVPNWLWGWAQQGFSEEDLQARLALRLPTPAPEGEEPLPTPAPKVDRLGFLQALGVHIGDTLVLMRHFLATGEGLPTTQKQINDLKAQGDVLEQSIYWLQQKNVQFLSQDERITVLRRVYNALESISPALPLPYIAAETAENALVYGLRRFFEGELYAIDAKQQAILAEKYGVSVGELAQAAGKANIALTNIELKGVEPKMTKIEEEMRLETLQMDAREWGASYYMRWREEVPYRVRLYAGEMPYRLRFADVVIKDFQRGNAVLFEEVVYVNQHAPNIEEELFKICKSATLSEYLVLQLLRYKNETAKETQHTIIEKVVEKVVVEDSLEEDEEFIENPDLETVRTARKKPKTRLKVALELEGLPEELLEQIMQYAQKSKVIMKKA